MGKKKLHFVHSGQSFGGSKFNVLKNGAKLAYFGAYFGVGSCFGPLRRQNNYIVAARLKCPSTICILAGKSEAKFYMYI